MTLHEAYAKTQALNERTSLVPQGWYGFDQPFGWSQIVLDLHEKIVALHPDYEVHQVKEKFGGLRYYCSLDGHPVVADLIRAAEEEAANTCQMCGATPAEVVVREGWLRTLCGVHAPMDRDQLHKAIHALMEWL